MSDLSPGLGGQQQTVTGREPGLPRLFRQLDYETLRLWELIYLMTDQQARLFACDCVEHVLDTFDEFEFEQAVRKLIALTRCYARGLIAEPNFRASAKLLKIDFVDWHLSGSRSVEYFKGAIVKMCWLPDPDRQRTEYQRKRYNIKEWMSYACNIAGFVPVLKLPGYPETTFHSNDEQAWQKQHAIEYLTGKAKESK